MWSILAALYPPNDNVTRVMKYRDHVGKLNCGMLEFPVKHTCSKMSQLEDANNVSITIYKYDPKYKAAPLRVSENQSRDKVIDLLLHEDKDGNTQYTWLKNMSHLMHGLNKSAAKLEKHKVICTNKGFIQRCVFPQRKINPTVYTL